ncbi:MAG: nucleotidyltransferase domain-containing protein [Gemmatimonadota bacterium]|nr:nucleotidyltransferase domain-containing protein [Gemmatimonadota bacterium]
MTVTSIDRTAERIRDRILEIEGDRLVRIILFGSRARGNARDSSDYDLLVVLREPIDCAEEQSSLSRKLSDIRPRADVHVYGEEEFEEESGVAGTVAYPAAQHGTFLYENTRSGQGRGRSAVAGFRAE